MFPKGFSWAARVMALIAGVMTCRSLPAEVITFEDLSLAAGSHNVGPMPNAAVGPGPFGATQYSGSFASGGVEFFNRFLDFGGGFTSWDGFGYSNEVDTTTPGFTNQYSAFAGADHTAAGNGVFGLAFVSTSVALQELPHLSIPAGMAVAAAYVTNTTYTALSMRDGDGVAKKFGGATGNDPDYLRIRAYGADAGGNVLNTAEFYLSDFRSADNSQDYIVSDWERFDLSALAGASTVYFDVETSDVGAFGPNTPLYFAIDDIQLEAVPEPSACLLALAAGGVLWRTRRRRKRQGTTAG